MGKEEGKKMFGHTCLWARIVRDERESFYEMNVGLKLCKKNMRKNSEN